MKSAPHAETVSSSTQPFQTAGFFAVVQVLTAVQEVFVLADKVARLEARIRDLERQCRAPSPSDLLDTEAAAGYLGVSRRTVEGWRYKGTGPAHIGGRPVLYRREDLKAWQKERKVGE